MKTEKIACVGAGLIGQGWATVFASRGFEVALYDTEKTLVEDAVRGVRRHLTFLEENGLLQGGEAAASAAERIRGARGLEEAVCGADYVQESVFDDYPVKKQVFRDMDALAPAHAVLASSTSGLLMTEIQAVTRRPDRCVLVHPFLPVHLVPVVEIVGGKQTSEEAVQKTCALMKDLGKTPVLLKREVPGFIVNRLQAAVLREAIDLVTTGVATAEDVDKAFCMSSGLRDPILGPFLRIHLVANGIERFTERYAQSYHYRWRSMATWTEIPVGAGEAIVRETRALEKVRSGTVGEIAAWRDSMLVKFLKLLQEDGHNG